MEQNGSTNVALLLHTLWSERELSRADLARRTDLSRSTVTQLVPPLLDLGIVYESHVGRSRGGRPPVILRFQDEHAQLIGVDMGSSHISVVRTNLRGVVAHHQKVMLDVPEHPQQALATIERLVHRVSDPSLPVLGIGLAVPCAVEPLRKGELSPRILPGWVGIRPVTALERAFGVPVFMENDANLGALAERYWGRGGEDDFAFIKLATGVGAGLIIDGEIYRGAEGIAGEIGHTAIMLDGPRCRCGLHGCLEALIGSYALEARFQQALLGEHAVTSLGADAPMADIASAARAGDPLASQVVAEAGSQLGMALANLLNLMNPSRVVLSGRLTLAGEALLTPLRQAMSSRAMHSNVMAADVVPSALEHSVALGAATQVLHQALAMPARFELARPLRQPTVSGPGQDAVHATLTP